jgi:hypothetical protein
MGVMRHCHTVGEFIGHVIEKDLGSGDPRRMDPKEEPTPEGIFNFPSGVVNGVIEIVRTWIPELSGLEPDMLLPDLNEYPSNCEDVANPTISMPQRKLIYESMHVYFGNAASSTSQTQVQDQAIFCACMQIVAMLDHLDMVSEAPLIRYDLGVDTHLENALMAKEELVRRLQEKRRKVIDVEQQLANNVRDSMMTVEWEREKNKIAVTKLMDLNKALTLQLKYKTEEQKKAESVAASTVRQARENELLLERRKQEIYKLKAEAKNFYSVQVSCLQREKNFQERLSHLREKEENFYEREVHSIETMLASSRRGSKDSLAPRLDKIMDPSTGLELEQRIKELEAAALHHYPENHALADAGTTSSTSGFRGRYVRGARIQSTAVQTERVAFAGEDDRPFSPSTKQSQGRSAFPRLEPATGKKRYTTTQRRVLVEDLQRDVQPEVTRTVSSPLGRASSRKSKFAGSARKTCGPVLIQEAQDDFRSMGLRTPVLKTSPARTPGIGGGASYRARFSDGEEYQQSETLNMYEDLTSTSYEMRSSDFTTEASSQGD